MHLTTSFSNWSQSPQRGGLVVGIQPKEMGGKMQNDGSSREEHTLDGGGDLLSVSSIYSRKREEE